MRITVVGCGRWGSFIAWYLSRIGHDVILFGRPGSANMSRLIQSRSNDYLTLRDEIKLSQDLSDIDTAEVIVISVGSQSLRTLLRQMKEFNPTCSKIPIILCMKGLEIDTGLRLSQIVEQELGENSKVAVWLGPGHVQEFVRGVPNCMVIDSLDETLKNELVNALSSNLIRFYYGMDLVGNEIGAASKNVVGIAAGMLDGLGLSTLKGALMSRGTGEISRLINAMGGNPVSAYGLCHLGDYEATVFSSHSHNRRFGELFVQGLAFDKLAEGYYTVQAMVKLSELYGVELPICDCLQRILFEGEDPQQGINRLFNRSLRNEF